MIDKNKPQWLPLNKLPFFHSFVTGMLQDSKDQYKHLEEAKTKTQKIEDKLLNMVWQMFKDRQDYIHLNQKQVKRWQGEERNKKQEQQLIEVGKVLTKLQSVNDQVMALVYEQQEKK